ncbi:MAG: hypothetical protein NUV81_01180 [bacterium]|nr:hypothetical protein [bacterium]
MSHVDIKEWMRRLPRAYRYFGCIFLIVLCTGVVAWLPYWILNGLHLQDLTVSWWRVPVMTPGVFDTYVYLNWIGESVRGSAFGGLFKWYALLLKSIWSMMASWSSVPEIWIVTRWISLILFILIVPWTMRLWSKCSRKTSWVIASGLFFALSLSIGLRPGAYSWYLPFAFFSIVGTSYVYESLNHERVARACVWTLGSLFLSMLYPWFFLFVGLWLASIWFVYFTRRNTYMYFGFVVLCIGSICGIALPLAHWFLAPERAAMLGIFERTGIVFARIPFFANTVLAFGAWLMLFGILGFVFRQYSKQSNEIIRDSFAWIVMVFLWFSTPFTGIHLYSDHLIGPTIILAWLSLSTVWNIGEQTERGNFQIQIPRFFQYFLWLIAIGATLFVAYIIQQPIRGNPLKFDSYAVHVLNWFALTVASWIVIRSIVLQRKQKKRFFYGVVLFFCVGIGIWGMTSVVLRDTDKLVPALQRVSVINWLRLNMSLESEICSDPESAPFYAAHTGLRIYPAEATLTYAVTNEAILHMLEVIVGAYDVQESKTESVFHFDTDYYRTIPCAAASKYSHNAWWYAMLMNAGISSEQANRFIGCRQETLDENWNRISSAMKQHQLDEDAFRVTCPAVIIPDEQRDYWQLPSTYQETRVSDSVSIWRSE